jgi:hypothetical protein
MRRLLLPACLLLLAICPTSRADFHDGGPDCCSTYPIYLCRPGYLSYPMPPRELALYDNGTGSNNGCGCSSGCGGNGNGNGYACGVITPNPYTCCFYGVTLSNYGLITPYHGAGVIVSPSRLPALPPLPGAEKLPAPAPAPEKLPTPNPR